MDLKACAFNTGTDHHLLDHIAPLASLLSIPLIVTEPENEQLARSCYPELSIRYWPDLERRLGEIAQEFDTLIECKYWMPHLKELFRTLFRKEMRLIFCPHGQSDKGYGAPLLAPYALQDAVLLYGNLLQEMLTELKIWPSISRAAFVGNYRHLYYQIHKKRLDALADQTIFSHLNPKNQTLLYAPTWIDLDGASTFFTQIEKLEKQTPSNWNVLVKVHPLLPQRNPALYCKLEALQETKSNWIVVEKFPPIYPILNRIDAYLGDYSSIGYDVLTLQKPMFFFSQPNLPPARLHTCGEILNNSKHLFDSIEKGLCKASNFARIQSTLAEKAFSPVPDLKRLIQSLAAEG